MKDLLRGEWQFINFEIYNDDEDVWEFHSNDTDCRIWQFHSFGTSSFSINGKITETINGIDQLLFIGFSYYEKDDTLYLDISTEEDDKEPDFENYKIRHISQDPSGRPTIKAELLSELEPPYAYYRYTLQKVG